MKLLVSTDSLVPPLTGIGYYMAHLVDELSRHDDIEIRGVGDAGVRPPAELARQVGRLLEEASPGGREASPGGREASPVGRKASPLGREPSPAGKEQPAPRTEFSLLPPLLSWGRRLTRRSVALDTLARHSRRWRQGRALAPYKGWLLHANYIPPPHTGPTVVTVPDLSHIRCPETHPRGRRQWLTQQLPGALDRAAHILAISHFTRNELLELGLVRDEQRISVVHLGHSAGFHPRTDEDLMPRLSPRGLTPRGYVLSLATLEPRKNFKRLLQAYQRLPAALARQYPLVLAGVAGWKNRELMAELERVRPPHRVVLTGYLDRHEVQSLLAGAAVFAYPSLYEGFGLPALEALASGTPVLTSSGGAMAEVVADSGYCVDPLDTDAIENGLRTLLEQSALAERLRLSGLVRAAQFSWQRCAREHMAVYRQLI